MAKSRTVYVCSECGQESSKWVGQCPSCNSWNSFKKFTIQNNKQARNNSGSSFNKAVKLEEINLTKSDRLKLPLSEFNRVIGVGLVPGTIALIAGEPGVGKSTLLLQVLLELKNTSGLYCAGEESLQQVKLRAERVGENNSTALFTDDTDVDKILQSAEDTKAGMIIVDSIQTAFCNDVDSAAGSITQIRESAARMIRFAKKNQVSFIFIGHITKSGNIAGPMILEHMVDVVLQFEGDRNNFYRILRARKNRFGNTQEIGVFEMAKDGLREVSNPSDMFVSNSSNLLSGISLAASLEGIRPMIIELQALVSSAVYGNPQRTSTGFDTKRLNMILAVLEKRAGFRLNQKDVFVNIVGGLKILDPGLDLPMAAAVLSSDQDISIPEKTVLCGEIGLSGEIRMVSRINQRISEASRLGFKRVIIPKPTAKEHIEVKGIEIVIVSTIADMMKELFK